METTIFKMTMQTRPILFHTTDWSAVPITEHRGETGTARWQTIQHGTLRIRVVEYSNNYVANGWCNHGHILYCLEGEMITELADGRVFSLTKGMSYEVSDGANAHRSRSEHGVKLLIIDGAFLRSSKNDYNPWKM
ncbi:MAG TPA: DHCW motif cupin fold protein [Chryseolinea sp.]|nr:DHCW motif cupin fold protein [Chryseolinea sp.]